MSIGLGCGVYVVHIFFGGVTEGQSVWGSGVFASASLLSMPMSMKWSFLLSCLSPSLLSLPHGHGHGHGQVMHGIGLKAIDSEHGGGGPEVV